MSTAELPAPPWSNKKIIAAARRLAAAYEELVGRDHIQGNGWRFDEMYAKLLYPKFGIALSEGLDLGKTETGRKILGLYKIEENLAQIDAVMSETLGDPRRVFTLYHEVAGHGALQGGWLRSHVHRLGFVEVTDFSISHEAELALERQANLFASHLAAPDWLIDWSIQKVFGTQNRFRYIGPSHYWLTSNGLSIQRHVGDVYDLCQWIGGRINQYFGGLSGEALGYRIAERGWIDDKTQTLGTPKQRRGGRLFRAA